MVVGRKSGMVRVVGVLWELIELLVFGRVSSVRVSAIEPYL